MLNSSRKSFYRRSKSPPVMAGNSNPSTLTRTSTPFPSLILSSLASHACQICLAQSYRTFVCPPYQRLAVANIAAIRADNVSRNGTHPQSPSRFSQRSDNNRCRLFNIHQHQSSFSSQNTKCLQSTIVDIHRRLRAKATKFCSPHVTPSLRLKTKSQGNPGGDPR